VHTINQCFLRETPVNSQADLPGITVNTGIHKKYLRKTEKNKENQQLCNLKSRQLVI